MPVAVFVAVIIISRLPVVVIVVSRLSVVLVIATIGRTAIKVVVWQDRLIDRTTQARDKIGLSIKAIPNVYGKIITIHLF
jgi:hypothetical protein